LLFWIATSNSYTIDEKSILQIVEHQVCPANQVFTGAAF
jgi:hypothetical protein